MAYVDEDEVTPEFLEDVLLRKEFALLRHQADAAPSVQYKPIWDMSHLLRDPHLSLTSYQLFTAHFMNPNTPYTRLLLKWGTGSGKTIGALAIAMKYIELMKRSPEESALGSVYVLGFTESIFKQELLRFPQFGFITHEELERLEALEAQALHTRSAEERLKEMTIRIRKRLSNRRNNGFFQFMGYKALASQLFISTGQVKVAELQREEILARIEDGRIKLNEALLREFSHSLLICDEMHNLYNSLEKNNWGVAIEVILNYNASSRAIFLSATPINNSPTEIVDILNLILPRRLFPIIRRENLFDENEQLLSSAPEKLRRYFTGRVSFIQDINPATFPNRVFLGESIPGIRFLKFVRTPLSKFHYAVYKDVVDDTLPQEGQYIMDFLLPDPEVALSASPKTLTGQPGIYKTREVQQKYEGATSKWRELMGLGWEDNQLAGPGLHLSRYLPEISAKYARMMRCILECIRDRKGKIFIYHNFIHMSGVLFIQEVLRSNGLLFGDDPIADHTLCMVCGKTKAQHAAQPKAGGGGPGSKDWHAVRRPNHSSVMDVIIGEVWVASYTDHGSFRLMAVPVQPLHYNPQPVLQQPREHHWVVEVPEHTPAPSLPWKRVYNSFYTNDPSVTAEDVAAAAAVPLAKGGAATSHDFQAARFFVAHSNIDKKNIQMAVAQFSSPSNTFGDQCLVLVGSRVLKESYTLKATRNIFVMSRPDNISILVQIMGRAVRNQAHALLPPEQRTVEVSLFTHCLPNGELTHEEAKYKQKVEVNEQIQKINLILHESAIDRYFNHPRIFRTARLAKEGDLDLLPYALPKTKAVAPSELKLVTFNAFHKHEELHTIQYILKRLFIEYSPVWTYANLRAAVKHPPFEIALDGSLFEDYIFHTALSALVFFNDPASFEPAVELSTRLIEKLHNPNEKILQNMHGDPAVIIHVEDMYMLVPFISQDHLVLNQDAPFRPRTVYQPRMMDIDGYMKERSESSFAQKRERLIARWESVAIVNMEPILNENTPLFHQNMAEEAIQYVAGRLSRAVARSDKHHVFWVKLLEYYSLRGLILWADSVTSALFEKYKLFVEEAPTPTEEDAQEKLPLSLRSTDPRWISSGAQELLAEKLNWIDNYVDKPSKKKVPAHFYPVGHFIADVPRLYDPTTKTWTYDGQYIPPPSSYQENDIIIGYDDRSKTTLNTKFKLRSPFRGKTTKDARLIEKGSVCMFKSKPFLANVAKKLGLMVTPSEPIAHLCQKIKNRLIRLEVKERRRHSKIKWYYFFYETRPELAA